MMPAEPAAGVVDPYLAWTRFTRFAGHSALAEGRQGFLPLLVKGLRSAAPSEWQTPPVYDKTAEPFWTAWVAAKDLASLDRARVELSMSLPVAKPAGTPESTRPPVSDSDLVIGIIDQGCAFLNRAFAQANDAHHSRIVSLWRQRPAAAKAPWGVPADMGYGLELSGESISQRLRALKTPADEAKVYEELGYPVDDRGHFSSELHGTHVLDIAAGLPQDLPPEVNAKPRAPDAAAHAALVFVELPSPLPEDTTGASCDAFVLDAVHYILRRAGTKARVVINLSFGSLAGPHDGSSLLEQALDQLVEAHRDQLSICVAAGNAAQERWHASGSLPGGPGGDSATLSWRTMPGDLTDSFLELWCFGEPGSALPDLQVEVVAPDGDKLRASLNDGKSSAADERPGRARLDLRQCPAPDHRPHRAMALLSLAPTAGPRAGQAAGPWQIRLTRGNSSGVLKVAVWLQRDTPGPSREPVPQSEIEAVSDNLAIDGRDATSALAGAQNLVTVGALGDSDRKASRYSPTIGIRAWAACDESPNAPGKVCTGALSGSTDRIAGTSAASPMVARALANGVRSGGWASSIAPPYGKAAGVQGQPRSRVIFAAQPPEG